MCIRDSDQLFGKGTKPKGDSKAKAPEVVDYFAALNQTKAKNVRLDGLAPGVGAVINGAFIAIGDPIPSLEYQMCIRDRCSSA